MRRRASAGRAARYLLPILAAGLAGCGSGSSGPASNHSAAGVQAAVEEFSTDMSAANFSKACEALTASARAGLGGRDCVDSLPRDYLLLGGELHKWLRVVAPDVRVQGDLAAYLGVIQARYEGGRWHVEDSVW